MSIIVINMNTKFANSITALAVLPVNTASTVANGTVSYIIGGIIALLIMGYLIYTLLHPEKF
jgi:K+-transporting ATPase KdpF subunit